MKYYSNENIVDGNFFLKDDLLKIWLEYYYERGMTNPIIIEEGKKDKSNERWCADAQEFTGGECGGMCDSYSPCNGKNGKCKHSRFSFSGTGKTYVLYRDGKLIKYKED